MSNLLTAANLKRNLVLNSFHEGCWGLGAAFHSSYAVIPLFLDKLGAPQAVVLSVAGLFSILLAAPQIFSAALGRNIQNHKAVVIGVHLLVLPPLFIMGFTFGLLAPTGPAAWVFYYICFILYGLSIGFILPIWANFMNLATDRNTRGRFFGISFLFNSLGGFIGGVLLKQLLESSIPFPKNFGLGFFITFLSLTAGILMFLGFSIRTPKTRPEDTTIRDFITATKSVINNHHHFKRYLLARIFFTANFPAISLYAVYMKDKFGFAISEAGIFTVINVIALGVGSYAVGLIGDRYGHKLGLVLAFGAHLAAIILAITAQSMLGVYAVFMMLGLGLGAFMPASMNLVYDFAGTRDTKTYMALVDTTIAPFTAMMILLAGAFIGAVPAEIILAVVGGFIIIGLLILIFYVKDPKHHPHDIPLPGNI